jgi:general secretion pathway protein E
MAIQAALTGHRSSSTLHTNDAPTAVTRMLDLGMPSYLINSTMLGVMAQRPCARSARTARPRASRPTSESWRAITATWRADKPSQVMSPVGCVECRMTGYRGRMGLPTRSC